ncbi:glutaryl-CoA dehydrogenase, mitochondrial-like, partial [Python bivittatus]|uniref:Glutaryl-CoA dehydrogenase, mitochondrial-like n=1 Tax=Python bivittatus TaxID=176946 RepID=A0A9F2R0L2_PYTBI
MALRLPSRIFLQCRRCVTNFCDTRAQSTSAPVPKEKEGKPLVNGSKVPKAQFDWRDALQLERLLTQEEIMIRDSFRAYCQEKLMPRILMANRNE